MAEEAADVFDSDKSSSAAKANKQTTNSNKANVSVSLTGTSHENDTDLSNKSFSKSRIIRMAIARHEQFPRLWDFHKAKLGYNQSLDTISTNGRTTDMQTIVRLSAAELAENRRLYGEESLLTLQGELTSVVLKEQLNEDNDELLKQTAKKWQRMVAILKTANVYEPDGKTSSKDINSFIKTHELRRVCRWAHDTGEVLAMLLFAHGENAEAKKIVRQITTVDRLLPFSAEGATVMVHKLLTLARLCASQNEYVEAKHIIALAKDISASQFSASIFNRAHSKAMCLLEESRLSLAQRDYTAAAELAQQTDAILSKATDMETSQHQALRADVVEQLARVLAASPGKLALAIENQEKCLHLRQKGFGSDGLFCAATSLDLARMLRLRLVSSGEAISDDSPDAVRGRELLHQIIAICKRNQKSDSEVLRADRNPGVLLSQAYYELGILEATCGNLAPARTNIQQGCDVVLKFTEPLFAPYKVASLDALAYLDLDSGKTDEARATILRSSKLLDGYVVDVLPQLSLAEQIAFSDNIEKHMNSLAAVCRDDASLGEVYEEMMRWKGFLIEQFRLRSQIIKQKGNEQITALLSSHRKLSSKILTSYVESAQSGVTPEIGGVNQKQKEDIERQINSKLRGKQSNSLSITPHELHCALAQDEVMIDLYEFVKSPWDRRSNYGAVIVSKSNLRWVQLGSSVAINSAVNSWRSYDGLRSDLFPMKDRLAGEIGPWIELTKLLYQPLCAVIPANTSRLVVADESELSRLPWSVLFSNYGGAREFQVAQIDSPREFLNLQRAAVNDPSRNEMLIVGGIDYSKHVPPAPPLKHALNELNEIKTVMEASHYKCSVQSDFIKGLQPTRQNIFDAFGKCQLAHLVTHGFFNDSDLVATASDRSAQIGLHQKPPQETRSSEELAAAELVLPGRNPLIESGLLISRGSKINADENGFLTAEDLLDANLQGCQLVTLSACETARGREVSSQGVLGLRSALMGAGADSVMLSLWPVPDKPTSELMKVFYRRLLDGDAPVVALRTAQAAVRSNPKWQAPYYWAAWILVGDGWHKLKKG
ncbi:MAG: CHAT domain-containing protein [Candidatus Obscuribacterales bacterium]|nr:CHAT domain-containing protein [Candidatus Obscuribacterales bacterium]